MLPREVVPPITRKKALMMVKLDGSYKGFHVLTVEREGFISVDPKRVLPTKLIPGLFMWVKQGRQHGVDLLNGDI